MYSNIDKIIKDKILNSRSLMVIFDQFDVSPNRLNELKITITDLKNKYAETDGKEMKLNSFLFKDSEFIDKYFFIVAHEIIHWLSRIRENDAYFNDPEEVLGFVTSIAYELEQKSTIDEIWNKIYPKVSWHFNDEEDSKEFFQNMLNKAQKLLTKE